MSLILGGVAIPLYASLRLSQTYNPISGSTTRRTLSGAAVRRTHWRRLSTTIRGEGTIPAGIQELDYDNPLTLACIAPRSVTSGSNVITLPAARRSDAGYTPRGFALVGMSWQETPVALTGDDATLTTVSGATLYRAHYFPELTVFSDPPQEDVDARGASYSWTLTAEEV